VLEIPFVAENQRSLRDFGGILIRRLPIKLAAVTSQFAAQAAQFRGDDRAVNDPECGGEAGDRSRKRPSGLFSRDVQVVMLDVKQGHHRSSKDRRDATRRVEVEDAD
jgi:hypothetical protein